MERFNQKEYIANYRKEHKSQFNVDLNKEEKDKLDILLREKRMTKSEFLRNAIKLLEVEETKSIIEIIGYIQREQKFAQSQKEAFEKQKKDVKFDSQHLKVYNTTDIAIKQWERTLEDMKQLEKFINCEFDKEDE